MIEVPVMQAPPKWSEEIIFSDVIGMQSLKRTFYRYYSGCLSRGAPPHAKIVILWGPPGVGKTYFARAVAGEFDSVFFEVKGSDLFSKWVGESKNNVANLIDEIRKHDRVVLHMDEIDGIFGKQGSAGSSVREGVVSEFLQAIDGIRLEMKSLLFIGETSLPRIYLPKMMGDSVIYVPLPDLATRKAFLERIFKQYPDGYEADIDLDVLAGRFERCSMRDVRRFGETLADIGITRKLDGKPGRIEAADMDQAWGEAGCKPIGPEHLAQYEKIAQELEK